MSSTVVCVVEPVNNKVLPSDKTGLPWELWQIIVSWLSVTDLCHVARVCRTWNDLVNSIDGTRWKELYLACNEWRHPFWPLNTTVEPPSWRQAYRDQYVATTFWKWRHKHEINHTSCLPALFIKRTSLHKTIHVGAGLEHENLKSALAVANAYDRIVVHPGIYDEQFEITAKIPFELIGDGELGSIILVVGIQQVALTARLSNLVLRAPWFTSFIVMINSGYLQIDKCILEEGMICAQSPSTLHIKFCTFRHATIILQHMNASVIENCEFSQSYSANVIIEGQPKSEKNWTYTYLREKTNAIFHQKRSMHRKKHGLKNTTSMTSTLHSSFTSKSLTTGYSTHLYDTISHDPSCNLDDPGATFLHPNILSGRYPGTDKDGMVGCGDLQSMYQEPDDPELPSTATRKSSLSLPVSKPNNASNKTSHGNPAMPTTALADKSVSTNAQQQHHHQNKSGLTATTLSLKTTSSVDRERKGSNTSVHSSKKPPVCGPPSLAKDKPMRTNSFTASTTGASSIPCENLAEPFTVIAGSVVEGGSDKISSSKPNIRDYIGNTDNKDNNNQNLTTTTTEYDVTGTLGVTGETVVNNTQCHSHSQSHQHQQQTHSNWSRDSKHSRGKAKASKRRGSHTSSQQVNEDVELESTLPHPHPYSLPLSHVESDQAASSSLFTEATDSHRPPRPPVRSNSETTNSLQGSLSQINSKGKKKKRNHPATRKERWRSGGDANQTTSAMANGDAMGTKSHNDDDDDVNNVREGNDNENNERSNYNNDDGVDMKDNKNNNNACECVSSSNCNSMSEDHIPYVQHLSAVAGCNRHIDNNDNNNYNNNDGNGSKNLNSNSFQHRDYHELNGASSKGNNNDKNKRRSITRPPPSCISPSNSSTSSCLEGNSSRPPPLANNGPGPPPPARRCSSADQYSLRQYRSEDDDTIGDSDDDSISILDELDHSDVEDDYPAARSSSSSSSSSDVLSANYNSGSGDEFSSSEESVIMLPHLREFDLLDAPLDQTTSPRGVEAEIASINSDCTRPVPVNVSEDKMMSSFVDHIQGVLVHQCRMNHSKGGLMVTLQAHAIISECEINNVGYGIRCIHNSRVVILKNKIHHCRTSGIFMRLAASGLIAGNDIHSNNEAGIDIRKNADPLVQFNQIHHGKRSGVVVLGSGRGQIKKNDIFCNAEAGVYILYGGNPTVSENYIYEGRAAGVAVNAKGKGYVIDNVIRGNRWGGIDIRNASCPVVSGNSIINGLSDGIVVGVGGKGNIENNNITGNSGSGIWMMSAKHLNIHGNQICCNGHCGIMMLDKSTSAMDVHLNQLIPGGITHHSYSQYEDNNFIHPEPTAAYAILQYNNISHNKSQGVVVEIQEEVHLSHNAVHGNLKDGVVMLQDAPSLVNSNSITHNTGHGLVTSNRNKVRVLGNGIYDNTQHGVLCQNECVLEDNDVVGQGRCAVMADGKSCVELVNNRLSSSMEPAVRGGKQAKVTARRNKIYDKGGGDFACQGEITTAHNTLARPTLVIENARKSSEKEFGRTDFLCDPPARPHAVPPPPVTTIPTHRVTVVTKVMLPSTEGCEQGSKFCTVL